MLLFGVPMVGSLALLTLCVFVFIAANLAVGFTFSTLARNQMQAMQMSMFFFLPSMLLSGFLFPFRGMPEWAQVVGRTPAAHPFPAHRSRHPAQGQRLAEVWPQLWPILLFLLVVVATMALRRYRQTLD